VRQTPQIFAPFAGEVGIGEFMAEIYFLFLLSAKLTLSILHRTVWRLALLLKTPAL
jgi:hypothetical protein